MVIDLSVECVQAFAGLGALWLVCQLVYRVAAKVMEPVKPEAPKPNKRVGL